MRGLIVDIAIAVAVASAWSAAAPFLIFVFALVIALTGFGMQRPFMTPQDHQEVMRIGLWVALASVPIVFLAKFVTHFRDLRRERRGLTPLERDRKQFEARQKLIGKQQARKRSWLD